MRDLNPQIPQNFFDRFQGSTTDTLDLPKNVRKLLVNPDRQRFPRVDRFERLLDYTEFDDPDGYVDMGVSLPQKYVPGATFLSDNVKDPVTILEKSTGVNKSYYNGLYKKILHIRFTKNQTARGKIRKCHTMVVVGDGQGTAGLGEGKSSDVRKAMRKAYVKAYRNLETFPLYMNRTLLHGETVKYTATTISVSPKRPGHGRRVHHLLHNICTAVGIQDIGGQVRGSMNRMNVVKGFFNLLRKQRTVEDIARTRGLRMTDLQHVYFGRPVDLY